MVNDCYELALYNPQSLNEEDQQDQKDLWIRMFERTKSYDQGMNEMFDWLRVEAFQHCGNKTHKVMQFLQEACIKVNKKIGKWNLWYNPIPGKERAQHIKARKVPEIKKEFVDMQVDEEQFTRRGELARVDESEEESSMERAKSVKRTRSKRSIKSDKSSESSQDKEDWPVRLKKNPHCREAEMRAER